MRTVIYAATRNLYPDLIPAIKSLVCNSTVEKIYILAEDDDLGFWLPDFCEIINVSEQTIFTPSDPNWENGWSWMTLMKAAYHRYIPERIALALDVDTICCKDISDLWDIDMSGYLFAGVRETTYLDKPDAHYRNAGVMLLNLDKLRSSGVGDEIISALKRRKWSFLEQDCYNLACSGSIFELPREYNCGRGTEPYGEPIIRHFMGEHNYWRISGEYSHYRDLAWEVALRREGVDSCRSEAAVVC